MSKSKKISLGVLTILPLLYLITFIVFFLSMVLTIDKQPTSGGMPPIFRAMMISHMLMMVLIMCLITFYAIHSFNNTRIPQDQKIFWTILIVCGTFIAMPIYWYLFIWKDSAVPINSGKSVQ